MVLIPLNQAIKATNIFKFVDDDHKLIPFMVDNYIHEQKVKSYYIQKSNLIIAYEFTGHFHLALKSYEALISDGELVALALKQNQKILTETVATILYRCESTVFNQQTFYLIDPRQEAHVIRSDYPIIAANYDILGFKRIRELEFETSKINRAVKKQLVLDSLHNPAMKREIQGWYIVGSRPLATEVQTMFSSVYHKYGVTKPAKGTHILLYYEAELSTNKTGRKVWVINGLKG